MKRSLISLRPTATLMAAAIFALAACSHKSTPAAATSTANALTVEVHPVETRTLVRTIAASGGLFAWQDAVIGSELGGMRVVDVRVNVGDSIKKGQVLARLSTDTVKLDLEQQEAAVADARAALAQAEANAARSRTMAAAKAISDQDLLAAETQAKSAKAKLAAALSLLDNQKVRLAQTSIVAPDDGTVSARTVTVGQVVSAGAELFRFIRGNRVEWRAELPAQDLLQVNSGLAVKVRLANGEVLTGKVREVAPTLDATSRSGLVYVDLPQGTKAKPGMFVSGELVMGNSPGHVVPGNAVVVRDGNSYVMTVDGANKVHALKVTTGQRDADMVEIKAGFPAGASVIAQGAGFLKDGDTVKVVNSKEPRQ
jgi:RND family efflux transporter MFP subunit